MTRWLLLLSVCVFADSAAHAGDPPQWLAAIKPGGDASSAQVYRGVWSVTINAEELKRPALEITLNLPDQQAVTIRLDHWESRAGYICEFDDEGNSYTVPGPEAQPEDLSWLWYGPGDGWAVPAGQGIARNA